MDNTDNAANKEKKSRKSTILGEVWGLLVAVALAMGLAIFVNFFILINASVTSGSMENTIMTGDRVIGFRLSYKFSDPKRGDIVIFKFPDDERVIYVKRIIGLPGEKVEIIGGQVYINGSVTPLPDEYVDNPDYRSFGPYQVPENAYFMLGDNRSSSADSRFWDNTFVYRDKIQGKVIFRLFPNPGGIA